ncbi:MAG: A/G-specific adenine glycosylase [Verrucomicrobiota bacterium]
MTCDALDDRLAAVSHLNQQKAKQSRDSLADGGRAFRKSLLNWFAINAKKYPWRATRDPYAILVSELMLQQTQVATVLDRGFYDRWMKRFPDTQTLACAPPQEVLKLWEGLGYYSRARNLQAAARLIETELKGEFPDSVSEIKKLPGVGPYTAGAVASFAFDHPAAIVDGNVARVLARIFDFDQAVDSSGGSKTIWDLAGQLMPRRKNAKSREYNSALMELGQTLCKRAAPLCDRCPVARFCVTRDPESLPVKKPRQKTVLLEEDVLFARRKDAILLELESGSRRKGMWKLPALSRAETNERPPDQERILLILKYSITKYRVTLYVHQVKGSLADVSEQGRQWVDLTELETLTLGAPYRRVLEKLL